MTYIKISKSKIRIPNPDPYPIYLSRILARMTWGGVLTLTQKTTLAGWSSLQTNGSWADVIAVPYQRLGEIFSTCGGENGQSMEDLELIHLSILFDCKCCSVNQNHFSIPPFQRRHFCMSQRQPHSIPTAAWNPIWFPCLTGLTWYS